MQDTPGHPREHDMTVPISASPIAAATTAHAAHGGHHHHGGGAAGTLATVANAAAAAAGPFGLALQALGATGGRAA
jgi:hypothetical protein